MIINQSCLWRLGCQRFARSRLNSVCQVARSRPVGHRSASTVPISTKPVYPERLLIYHAGTGRTVFIGCLKLTTIFLFSFSCLLIAPAFYNAPDLPIWAAPTAVVGGAIPMVYVMYFTAPFVSYVHVRLPIYARRSREQLLRWAESMSSTTEIDMTTMRLYGRPRVSRMPLGDLRTTKPSYGIANLIRAQTPSQVEAKRPWWTNRPLTEFYVGNERGKSREPSVWQKALERIPKA